jgi:hypothetical protein
LAVDVWSLYLTSNLPNSSFLQFFGGTETPPSPSLSPPRLETTSALSQSVPTNWGLGIEQHFTTAANTNENQTSDFNTSVDQVNYSVLQKSLGAVYTVRFTAKGVKQVDFLFVFVEMCRQAIVIRALSTHSASKFNILLGRWQHVWLVAIVPPERWGKMDRNDCPTAWGNFKTLISSLDHHLNYACFFS